MVSGHESNIVNLTSQTRKSLQLQPALDLTCSVPYLKYTKGNKNIKNVKGCRDGMPKSIQTRCRDTKIHNPSLHPA